jgi:threonine synthase
MPLKPHIVAHSLASGNPADGDLEAATAKGSVGAICAVPEEEVGTNMVLLAETSGVFGETAAGLTLGALREAVCKGAVRESDAVVLLVTGDGLRRRSRSPDSCGPCRSRPPPAPSSSVWE